MPPLNPKILAGGVGALVLVVTVGSVLWDASHNTGDGTTATPSPVSSVPLFTLPSAASPLPPLLTPSSVPAPSSTPVPILLAPGAHLPVPHHLRKRPVRTSAVQPPVVVIHRRPADPAAPALKQVAIPTPPVVTGLPYPAHCTVGHVGAEPVPDPLCTPGVVNPAVTQATIGSTICRVGWTATVRPLAANTGPVKLAAMRAYGLSLATVGTTELDHDVPLELGGSDDSRNLWPEASDIPNAGFRNQKDPVENDLKVAVCASKVTAIYPHGITLAAAQNAIAANWTTAEHVLGLK